MSKIEKMHDDANHKVQQWSFREEFLDTERLRHIGYGNLVLRRQAHLFLSHGVLVALLSLFLFWTVSANWRTIASWAGFSHENEKVAVNCYEIVTSVTQLPPPPPIAPPPPKAVAQAVEAPPNVGKIKTVAEAPPEQTLATQKEIKQSIQQGAGQGAASGSGDDVPMFVPCEKTPGVIDLKKPVYPEMARTAGITGKVFVSVLIAEDGKPMKAKIMKRVPSDCDIFDAVAIRSAMESRYYPAIQNSKPIKAWLTIPIRFDLS